MLMAKYGDTAMPTLISSIAHDLVGCTKERSGFYNRCKMHYYNDPAGLVANHNRKYVVKLEDLCSSEIVVGKCRYCGHVSNLERWRVSKVTKPGMTLDDLKKLLRCKKCNHKGDVELTIAKLPR